MSGERFVADAELPFGGNIMILQSIFCIMNRYAFGCSGEGNEGKIREEIRHCSDRSGQDQLHFGKIIHRQGFFSAVCQPKQDIDIRQCMIRRPPKQQF